MNLTDGQRNEVLQAVGTSISSLRKRIASAPDEELRTDLQQRLDELVSARNALESEWVT